MTKEDFKEKCNVMYHAMLQKVPRHHKLQLLDLSDYRMSMVLSSAVLFKKEVYHIWLEAGEPVWGKE